LTLAYCTFISEQDSDILLQNTYFHYKKVSERQTKSKACSFI